LRNGSLNEATVYTLGAEVGQPATVITGTDAGMSKLILTGRLTGDLYTYDLELTVYTTSAGRQHATHTVRDGDALLIRLASEQEPQTGEAVLLVTPMMHNSAFMPLRSDRPGR